MKKQLFLLLLAFLLIFSNVSVYSTVKAESNVTWTELDSKVTTDVNKVWTIKFSKPLDVNSVNSNTVYVKDANGNIVDTTLQVENNIVKVSPKNPYKIGQAYTLYIGPDIQTESGKKLKTAVKFNFTVEDSLSNIQLEKPMIYPSSSIPVGYSEEGFRLVVFVPVSQSELAVYDEGKGLSSVTLSYLNEANQWEEIGSLFDSGNLSKHSDEISGDGYYSINLANAINTTVPNTLKLRVNVELKNGKTLSVDTDLHIIQTSNGENVEEIMDVYNEIDDQLQPYQQTTDLTVDQVEEVVKENLFQQENVQSVEEEAEGVLEVTYESGLKSIVQIIEEDNEEAGVRSFVTQSPSSDEPKEKPDSAAMAKRWSKPQIPVSAQTRGDSVDMVITNPIDQDQNFKAFSVPNANEIVSRNVLLWAPFDDEFAPWNEEDQIEYIFNQSPLGFNVVKLENEEANIESLKNIANYGFVLLSTHGSGGKWVLTGEQVMDSSKYEVEQILGQIAIVKHITVNKYGLHVKAPFYAVNNKWFEANIQGELNNTVIFNSSCESTLTDSLWNVFKAKGAGAYYGFDKIVSSRFAYEKAIETVKKLVSGETTGSSFVPAKDPYTPKKAAIQLKGNPKLFYSTNIEVNSNLVNGNFEQLLSGWQTVGDARVISGLGSPKLVSPTEGKAMAIISTGLGYTTSLGKIQQTFYISPEAETLSFDWNYLSEEFLEFIGSEFYDPFTVTLTTKDGETETILHLTLNDLADQFGAYWNHDEEDGDGGDLISVSPAIQFDMGDVWMTGWQHHEYVIPDEFKGKTVTITFTAEDATDTIYDTAVLLDNIVVK